MTADDFKITDKEAIRKATCSPKSMPDEFLPDELIAEAMVKFKGDSGKIPEWSLNPHYTKGKSYPIYYNEGYFTIGENGVGHTWTPHLTAWTKPKGF